MARQWNDIEQVYEGLCAIAWRRSDRARMIPIRIPGAIGRSVRRLRFRMHYRAMAEFGLAERLIARDASVREQCIILQLAEMTLGPSPALFLAALGPSNTGVALYCIRLEISRKNAARRLLAQLGT